MARLLALDWDRYEARMIVARPQGDGVAIEQAVSVPLELEGQENATDGLEEQLSKAIDSLKVSKAQALTAIGRSLVELRTMKLPPAPDEELPDMVRFQAMREFSALKESSPLDFVPLGDAGLEPGEVMAAAVPAELSTLVHQMLTTRGHEPIRSVLRPASAASLAMRRLPSARVGVTLVIAQQADSAELAVAKNGTVVFTRSFRLPPNWHPGETGEPLLGEVRRTIAAAQNQLGDAKVDRIILFGTEAEHAGLQNRLSDRTKLPVEVIDPFNGLKVSGSQPSQPERFAGLIGMLQDEAGDVRPAIDFQNPRQRPVQESNRRQNVLLAATAATILLGLLFLWWWQHDRLNTRIRESEFAIRQMEDATKKLNSTVTLARKLDDWKRHDKNWLDELVHLSENETLSAEDFRLELLNGKTLPNGKGSILLRARSKDNDARQKFQIKMDDQEHDVVPGMVTDDRKQDDRYPILFNTTVLTDRYMKIRKDPPPADPAPNTVAADTAAEKEGE